MYFFQSKILGSCRPRIHTPMPPAIKPRFICIKPAVPPPERGTMGTGFLLAPTSGYPGSPVTPSRIGPPSTQKRGVTSINKWKNQTLKEMMLFAQTLVPKAPLTDTKVIVYFFQSIARPPVALRLYSRHWGDLPSGCTYQYRRRSQGKHRPWIGRKAWLTILPSFRPMVLHQAPSAAPRSALTQQARRISHHLLLWDLERSPSPNNTHAPASTVCSVYSSNTHIVLGHPSCTCQDPSSTFQQEPWACAAHGGTEL
jgi:hypothetical protein